MHDMRPPRLPADLSERPCSSSPPSPCHRRFDRPLGRPRHKPGPRILVPFLSGDIAMTGGREAFCFLVLPTAPQPGACLGMSDHCGLIARHPPDRSGPTEVTPPACKARA